MAINHKWFGPGLENIFNRAINLTGDTIKVALMKESYSPSEADEDWDDTHECDDADYSAGGMVLPISSADINYANGTVTIKTSAADGMTVFTEEGTISSYFAVIYSETAGKVISWVDFDGQEAATETEFVITWKDSEILEVDINV